MRFKLDIQLFGGRGASSSGGSGGGGSAGGGAASSLDELENMDYTSFPGEGRGLVFSNVGEEEVTSFFRENSNAEEIIKVVTPEERQAIRKWTEGYFMHGEQYGGWDSMIEREKEWTKSYDGMIDRSVLDKGIVVSRSSDAQLVLGAGVHSGSVEDFANMEGRDIICRGNLSTAAASTGLALSASSVEYKIHIPGGSKGAGMWLGDYRINGWGPEQREFMMNRDSIYKVGKTTANGNKPVVNLYWMGVMPHDYGKSGK